MYNDMNSKLEILKLEYDNLLQLSEKSIGVVTDALLALESIAKNYPFDNGLQQISFYKHTSPYFYEKYIYFVAIYNIESARPNVDNKALAKYYRKETKKLQQFYLEFADFYKYSRTGKTYLDNLYFTKDLNEHFARDAFDGAINNRLFTPYSIRFATLLAYEQLGKTLKNVILQTKGGESMAPVNNKLEWTDSKTGLTELIYAWKERGSFNNGRASIQQITEYLENVFGVTLGNTSRTYQQTLFRKSGPTTYLDELRNDAKKRADRL